MKHLKLILASMALTCFALFPAAASAADIDDLDVTMEVLDSIAGLDGQVMEMRGPVPNYNESLFDGYASVLRACMRIVCVRACVITRSPLIPRCSLLTAGCSIALPGQTILRDSWLPSTRLQSVSGSRVVRF